MRHRLAGDPVHFSAIPLLKTLAHAGPMRPSALASACELDASTVSRLVRQLEDRGMLERAADPEDGRASRVQVSDLGVECLRAGAERRRQLVADAIQCWPDSDREQLRVHGLVTGAFSSSLHDTFMSAVPLVLVRLAVALFLKEVPLAERQPAAGGPDGGPAAAGGDGSVGDLSPRETVPGS